MLEYLDIRLTKRERQCLYFAALDLSLEETAQKMHLSCDTIKTHRKFVLRKLHCKTMGGAICRGLQMNLFSLNRD